MLTLEGICHLADVLASNEQDCVDAHQSGVGGDRFYAIQRDPLDETERIWMPLGNQLSDHVFLRQPDTLVQFLEQSALVREVPVNRTSRDACVFGDLFERGLHHAVREKHALSGVQNLLTRHFGIRPVASVLIQLNRKHGRSLRNALFRSGAIGLALFLAACDNQAATPAPPAPSVTVSEMKAQSVALRFQYAGRVAAFREVEVRARVTGILQEKTFVEGATVKEGDILFRIDPVSYQAELARAKAQLKEAQAQISRTQRDAERATTLLQRQVGTEKARDDATSAYELALATVAGAEAQVKTAEINLGYTTIAAPLAGVISLRVLPEGSLVGTGADNSLLTRISELETVYVYFSFSDTEATEIRRLIDTGEGKGPADGKLKAKISFGDGKKYGREGYVDFTDSNLDLQTGTVRARAIIPNPESKLRPGQFVRVSVEGITRHESIVIPQAAVMQGPQGQFVYAVDAYSKASIRPVTIGREVDDGWVVEKGLKAGDLVVTEGVIKVKPESKVAASASVDVGKTKAAQR